MVHPTLLVAFPGFPETLARAAQPLWTERLGPKALALEVVGPKDLERGFVALLSQARQLELKRRGLEPEASLSLVVLAKADQEGLPGFLETLKTQVGQGPWAGMELRLHLVLFLLGPEGLEALKALSPDPGFHPPTRVWPVSRWGRNGLYLPKEEHLAVWVQHFVEALVASRAPLQPEKGLDWVGLGIARLELERPSPQALVPILWEGLQKIRIAPAPEVPPPPSRAFTPSPPLTPPKRESCTQHPEWNAHLSKWEAYRSEQTAKAMEAGEEALALLDSPTPYELGRRALLAGLPALPETLTRLEAAAKTAEEERKGLLEILDRTAGVAEKRARLHRLMSRKNRLRGQGDLEREVQELEKELEPVDQAIGEGDVAFFLRRDPEAQEAEQRLTELAQKFQNNAEQWQNELEEAPAPPTPFWKRWLLWLWRTLARPTKHQEAEETRKRLCDRAWQLLFQAWAEEEKRTQRYFHYEAILHRFALLTEYLKALSREQNRATGVQKLVEGFSPAPSSPEENPLVIRIPQPILSSDPELQAAARLLLKEGALEALWDGDLPGLEARLREAAERLADQVGSARLPTPAEELWSPLVAAAAPRVLARHWPEHHQYAYVLGPAPGTRWGEAYDREDWLPGESILLRLVFPLAPEHLLEDTVSPLQEAVPGPPEEPKPTAEPGKDGGEIIRNNPLLDELLASDVREVP
ncbi:hypothetical protein [Thermus scotoductus]|uniref:hypothetical protein n=1 Tax=Thermus scotoductus TaxID=37636 RepID=UPI00056EAB53|nr:hypothetical protein [Thermus scotoductus]